MLGSGADGKRRIPLRAFLSFIILAALLPPLILLALVVFRTAETDQRAAQTSLVDNAKVIASMVSGALLSDAQILRTIGEHAGSAHGNLASEVDLISDHFAVPSTSSKRPMLRPPDPRRGASPTSSISGPANAPISFSPCPCLTMSARHFS